MSETQLPRLPYNFAAQYGICLLNDSGHPTALYKSGLEPSILLEVRRFAGVGLECKSVDAARFEQVLTQAYQHDSGAAQKFADDAGEAFSLSNAVNSVAENEDLLAQEDNAPIIRLINALLMEAIRENASDIHIETFEKSLIVRLRIDGILQETLKLRASLAPLLVSRIKVMARLDIAEKRLPQDGRISIRIGGRELDVRVSTLASGAGERVVMRLLDKQAGSLALPQLGLNTQSMETLLSIVNKPHGILLITGPTGSGKTTTLYAMLSKLNDKKRNIMTVEDPVEYQIEGIGQTQVNPRIELTFARGLRAILRQDPDVVMIGEIRDVETAGIAVQASLTGHLVLSTLHTNSAIGAVTRLIDMGVEPFLLSSSLMGLVAQRLVRRLCSHCKQPSNATQAECNFLGIDDSSAPQLYKPVGCESCRHSGYKGRMAIYEIIAIDDRLRTMIHNRASEQELEQYARQHSQNILQDGRHKILEGLTSCEEVQRVTSE